MTHFCSQLRLSIVEALGNMSHIMSKEKLEEQLPKLIPGVLALYKKHPDPYHVTQVGKENDVFFAF